MVQKIVTEELRTAFEALFRFMQKDCFLERLYNNVISVYQIGETLADDEWFYLRVKLILVEAKLVVCPSQFLNFRRDNCASLAELGALTTEELSSLLVKRFPDNEDSDSMLEHVRAQYALENFFSLTEVLGEYSTLHFRNGS